jgi:formate C-acetyltransferase
MFDQWIGFESGTWMKTIDVRDFIQMNYTPYDGDATFLAGATARTDQDLWHQVLGLMNEERDRGILAVDTSPCPPALPPMRTGYI